MTLPGGLLEPFRCSDCGAVLLATRRWWAWLCPTCDMMPRPYDWGKDGDR